MIKFNREVTSPRFDCVFLIGVAVVCLVLAVIPPFGMLTVWWAVWSIMNFAGGWKAHLRMVDAARPQGRLQMPIQARRPVAPSRWVNRRNFLWRAPMRGVRPGQHVKK